MSDEIRNLIERYEEYSARRALTDEFLSGRGCETRSMAPDFGEYEYGIVFVRDDLVEKLIAEIRVMEAKIQ